MKDVMRGASSFLPAGRYNSTNAEIATKIAMH
jgi:hypothetical protein